MTAPEFATATEREALCGFLDLRQITAEWDLGTPCAWPPLAHRNLRWVLLHMIEETARHAGHADIIRETLDGSRGY
jgi:Protein of unknown function (DUF664)